MIRLSTTPESEFHTSLKANLCFQGFAWVCTLQCSATFACNKSSLGSFWSHFVFHWISCRHTVYSSPWAASVPLCEYICVSMSGGVYAHWSHKWLSLDIFLSGEKPPCTPHHTAIMAIKAFSTFYNLLRLLWLFEYSTYCWWKAEQMLQLIGFLTHNCEGFEGNYSAESFNCAAGCHSSFMKCFVYLAHSLETMSQSILSCGTMILVAMATLLLGSTHTNL